MYYYDGNCLFIFILIGLFGIDMKDLVEFQLVE